MLCMSRVWLITRVYFPIAGIEYLTITWRENLCYEHVATLGVWKVWTLCLAWLVFGLEHEFDYRNTALYQNLQKEKFLLISKRW